MAKSSTARRRGPGRPSNPIKREDLLAIAEKAFAESGYTGTSTAEIARRANLSKASLFHHFPSKEGLYLEVVGTTARTWLLLLQHAFDERGSALDKQDRFSEMVIEYFGKNPESAKLFLRDMIDSGPFMRSGGWEAVDSALNIAADILQRGMDDKELRQQDPKQAILSLVGVHLFYFAATDVSKRFIKVDDLCSKKMLSERTKAVLSHVRSITAAQDSHSK
jgi:TetR/AcrR family transcriptional regulator